MHNHLEPQGACLSMNTISLLSVPGFSLPLRRPCTTGFIFGYLYGGKNCTRKIEWWSFMSKRLAGLYPLYLASIIAGESSSHPPGAILSRY
jgi:hypothetical protein